MTDGNGNITNEYVFMAGRRIARRNSSGNVYYYYSDALGTPMTITDSSGNPCYVATYTPYGQEMATTTSCPQNYKFTGYEQDTETGLYYAIARYYSPRLGRFLSPDPLNGDTSNPQSFNRYAYVGNNALNAVDPLGLRWVAPRVPRIVQEPNDFMSGFGMGGCNEFDLIDPNSFCNTWLLPELSSTWTPWVYQFVGNINGKDYDVKFNTWDDYANWRTSLAAGAADPCVYLNNAGTGLDNSAAPIDYSSSQRECEATGGQWMPEGYHFAGVDANGKIITCDGPCISNFAQQALGGAGVMASGYLSCLGTSAGKGAARGAAGGAIGGGFFGSVLGPPGTFAGAAGGAVIGGFTGYTVGGIIGVFGCSL